MKTTAGFQRETEILRFYLSSQDVDLMSDSEALTAIEKK